MFRVNKDTCRFKPRSSKLAWRSSRVPQIVCGSHPLRCGRTVRSMSLGFFLAASTFMDRNDKINTSSNTRFVAPNLTLVEKALLQIGKNGEVWEE